MEELKKAERYLEALRRANEEEDEFFQGISDTLLIMIEEGKTFKTALDLIRTGVRR
jgi:hypothetical protein